MVKVVWPFGKVSDCLGLCGLLWSMGMVKLVWLFGGMSNCLGLCSLL